MVRRTGRARRSYAYLRLMKYRLKWTHDTIPIQFKLLARPMAAKIEDALGWHDYLEVQVFAKLKALGVPSEEWPFYMAFAKRVFQAYMNFWYETAATEVASLKTEFIMRGLDSDVLDGVAAVALEKAKLQRGIPPPPDYVQVCSETRVETASNTMVDDTEAVLHLDLASACSVFIIYNAGNKRGSTEYVRGKQCAINIDGEDKATSSQSPFDQDHANSVTVTWAGTLSAGSHTIKGRFRSHIWGRTIGIDHRRLIVIHHVADAYFIAPTTEYSTISETPIDDPDAILNFTLSKEAVVLIIYNAGNTHGRAMGRGIGITINIDAADIATRAWQIGYRPTVPYDSAQSATIVYLKSLAAGNHTIKGRWFSNGGENPVVLNERQLCVFVLPTPLYCKLQESAIAVSTTSGTPVDDTQATVTFTLSKSSKVFALYTAAKQWQDEHAYGKRLLLNVDGSPEVCSNFYQSTASNLYPDSVTSLFATMMDAGQHTVQGRFCANAAGNTVTIAHRQLVVFAFS